MASLTKDSLKQHVSAALQQDRPESHEGTDSVSKICGRMAF